MRKEKLTFEIKCIIPSDLHLKCRRLQSTVFLMAYEIGSGDPYSELNSALNCFRIDTPQEDED